MEIAVDAAAIPVTILTGFLGAGKTTLLNRLLSGSHGLRVAVLVNDFGAINIDAELIAGVEDNAISLANGCVCCQIRDDLIRTIDAVTRRPEPPQYIVLEASGVADPGDIALTFMLSKFRGRVRLDSIVCVVDADQLFTYAEYPELQDLKAKQVDAADLVVLNKVDLVSDEALLKVKQWIDGRSSDVHALDATHCDVPMEILLGSGRFDARRLNEHEHEHEEAGHHDHGDAFVTWSYENDQPLSLDALRQMVQKLPGTLYRCKGVVYAAEEPQRRVILQVVGRRAAIVPEDAWGERTPRTRIVAIGAPGGVNDEALTAQFDACLAEGIPRAHH